MKTIFLLVSFLSVGLVYSTPVDSSEEIPDELLMAKAAYDYLNKKCSDESDPTKNVTNILEEVINCLQPHIASSPEELSAFCDNPEKMEKIPDCFLPAINIVQTCGDDEEKYLPEFIIDAIRNLIKFVCADEGKNIQKLTQESAMKCFSKAKEDGKTTLNPCDGDGFFAMMQDGVVTKKELCDAMDAERVCNAKLIEKICPDDSNVKEFYEGVVGAIEGPCSK